MWLKILVVSFLGFSNTLTASFELGGLMSGNSMAGVPLGRSLSTGLMDLAGVCSGPGFFCLNCTHAVTCVTLPVGYLMMPLQDACAEGLSCNAHEKKCSDQVVPECDPKAEEYQHICEQVGIFPDAYDCRKFHLCSPPEGFPDGRPAEHRAALCPKNYGYNPQTAQCSIPLHRGQCQEKPVPECTEIGQSDVLKSSPNHYYICIQNNGVLRPQIFICPHGWIFTNGFCGPEQKPEITSDRYDDRNHLDSSNDRDKAIFKPTNENEIGKDRLNTKYYSDSNEQNNKRTWNQDRQFGSSGPKNVNTNIENNTSSWYQNRHFGPPKEDQPLTRENSPSWKQVGPYDPDKNIGVNSNENVQGTNFGRGGSDEFDNARQGDFNSLEERLSPPEEEDQDIHKNYENPKQRAVSSGSSEEKPTITKIDSFFSTEKTITYPSDTFLADKFDMTNYESTDDGPPPVDDFTNSFETGVEWF